MAINTDIATRALVVTLKSPLGGKTTCEVACQTGLSEHTINYIYATAIRRGFEPNGRLLIIKDEFVQDVPRTGRPSREREEIKQSAAAKNGRIRHVNNYSVSLSRKARPREDENDAEIWIDEEDD